MNFAKNILVLASVLATLFAATPSAAVTMNLEQKYQDVFVSAGYSTALGAAVGAALLSFQPEPTDHLRYIALGASIGFFAGTAFGTYLVVAPSFATNEDKTPSQDAQYAAAGAKEGQLIVQPVINTSKWKFNGVEAGMVLAKF